MSFRTSLNTSLQKAINARNCNEVKILIADGADVNHTVNQYLDTMLHKAKSAGIARDLLGYSANVHAKNVYDQTPLHSAAIEGKVELVKTLLEHAANVDAIDSKGRTPLHYAVEKNNVEVIKQLVMNNANVTFQPFFLNDPSPMYFAMLQDDMTGVKALIKYNLLRKFPEFFSLSSDLAQYCRTANFIKIRNYFRECRAEILKMHDVKMNNEVTLFQIVMSLYVPLDVLYKDLESMELFTKRFFQVLSSNDFPQYRDVIIEKFTSVLPVGGLRRMLSRIQVSSVISDSNAEEPTTLSQDINFCLAKYLPKTDLFNLILASFEPSEHKLNPAKPNLKRTLIHVSAPYSANHLGKIMKLL